MKPSGEWNPKARGLASRLASPRVWLALALVLAGCNVGPKYERPPVLSPASFKEASPAAYLGASPDTWRPARPSDAALKGKWWEAFGEPELNGLEDQLNIDNQNIAQYFQSFMAARAQVAQARAGYFPTVGISPSYSLVGAGSASSGGGGATVAPSNVGATGGTTGAGMTSVGTTGAGTSGVGGAGRPGYTTNFFSLPLDVSWEPDFWGRVKNTVQEYRFAAQVSAADLENERLTEQADLAAYYFELRGQDWLQDVYDRTVRADRKALELTQALVAAGVDSPEAVAEAEVTLANAEEASVGVATNRALYEHAIATLVGKPASTFSLPVKSLATPVPAIPVGIPSQLLERRPDIAAAERTMAQANAVVGVAKAAYYPTVTLSGSVGLQSTSLGTLFSLPALVWSLGASASQTIYDGGLRGATVAQYVATYKADVAAYRQTVLTAFQQVEDYTATLRILSQQIRRQNVAIKAAERYLDIATAQYETGIDPYLNVITAENTLLSDQQTLVTLRVSELTTAVQLIQALGGGWDTTRLPAASKIDSKEAADQVLRAR